MMPSKLMRSGHEQYKSTIGQISKDLKKDKYRLGALSETGSRPGYKTLIPSRCITINKPSIIQSDVVVSFYI
jgi:hypothetical protein